MDAHEAKSEYQLTRELELLISGALIFALLQLPGLLDGWWQGIQVHVGGTAFAIPFSAYYVGKIAAYGLIATILFHFLLRGFWVALLGLRGFYPDGVDQERLPQGPFLRAFYEKRLLSLGALEQRVDRVGALTFSFVFLFLLILINITIWAVLSGIGAYVISLVSGGDGISLAVFLSLFACVVLLQSGMALIDKRSKKQALSPRTERVANRVMLFVHYASLNFLYGPVFLTLSTRVSRRVVTVIQVAFLYSLIGAFVVSVLASAGLLRYDSYIYFPPNPGNAQLAANAYESLRDASSGALRPTIQAEMIVDPYIRLFLPYDVRRDNRRIRRLCPDLAPYRGEGLFKHPGSGKTIPEPILRRTMDCFARLQTVQLDGKPLTGVEPMLYVHPKTGVHGRLLMIPMAPLAPGRHELLIDRMQVPGAEDDRGTKSWTIPFWK